MNEQWPDGRLDSISQTYYNLSRKVTTHNSELPFVVGRTLHEAMRTALDINSMRDELNDVYI